MRATVQEVETDIILVTHNAVTATVYSRLVMFYKLLFHGQRPLLRMQ